MIEQNAHSGDPRQGQTSGGMVENCARLFDGDAREPLDKLSDLGPIFKILKES